MLDVLEELNKIENKGLALGRECRRHSENVYSLVLFFCGFIILCWLFAYKIHLPEGFTLIWEWDRNKHIEQTNKQTHKIILQV